MPSAPERPNEFTPAYCHGFYATILSHAPKFAGDWSGRSATKRLQSLKQIIERIVIHPDQIEIRLRLPALLDEISDSQVAGQTFLWADQFTPTTSITCPFHHVPQGRALRLIVGHGQLATNASRQAVVRAIACARSWYEQIISGKASCLRDLTRRDGIDGSWAKKIFPLAFLSPANIEAILRSDTDITLNSLRANMAMDWSQQNIL